MQAARHFHGEGLVLVLHADEHRAGIRQAHARGQLRLDEGFAEAHAHAHHFTGRLHFRTQDGVHARELHEREHGFLDREIRRHDFLGDALGSQRLAGHGARGDLGQLQAGGLGHVRHRARGARVHFQHVDVAALDRELHVHQAAHVQGLGHHRGLALDLGDHVG
ncbi:hypothetical protein D9M68_726680 [compost metagenome]